MGRVRLLLSSFNDDIFSSNFLGSGEHGIGIGKKEFLKDELGEGTVNLMKTVKKAIDPYNLMNPGKLYPDEPGAKSSGH
jgi:D-lactate dehydrogenase (cytochrome)